MNNVKFAAIYVATPDGDEYDLHDLVAMNLSNLLADSGKPYSSQIILYIDNGYYPYGDDRPALKALTDDIESGLITEVYMQGRSMLPDTIDNMYGFSALVKQNDIKISFLNYGE
jgi:hypothetical protein